MPIYSLLVMPPPWQAQKPQQLLHHLNPLTLTPSIHQPNLLTAPIRNHTHLIHEISQTIINEQETHRNKGYKTKCIELLHAGEIKYRKVAG